MLDICDLFLLFIYMFIKTNNIISLKWGHLFLCTFIRACPLFLDGNVDEESNCLIFK